MMMRRAVGTTRSVDPVSHVIALLYDASLDLSGEHWIPALDALRHVAGALGCATLAFQRDRYDFRRCVMVDGTQRDADVYVAHYGRIDPCLEQAMIASPAGTANVTDNLMLDRDLCRTEFYTDWLAPRGVLSGIGTILNDAPSARAVLFLTRERSQGHFPADCLSRLQRLMPHLQHAVRVASRMAELAASAHEPAQVVRDLSDAVLVTDARAQLVYSNDSADRLLARGDTLSAYRPRGSGRATLGAIVPADTVSLQALIAAVCQQVAACHQMRSTALPDAKQSGGAVVLRRPSGARPLLALVAPLRMEVPATHVLFDELAVAPREPRALVIIIDPEPATTPVSTDAVPRAYLRAAFGLTDAEAAVALSLAGGCGLSAVAEQRSVSLATVRAQAQKVYDKTGLRTQAALASFLARMQAGIARAGRAH